MTCPMTILEPSTMTTHSLDFNMYKSWSLLDPKPVIINDTMCFWFGLFMHTNMAFAIAGMIFNRIPVCPSQKESLWELTREMIPEAKKLGYEVDWNFSDYNHDRLYSYLRRNVGLSVKEGNLLQDWMMTDKPFKFFLQIQ